MRKAVKLAAMSTLAAVAMVGGSATVASADGGNKVADNICGNTATAPLVGHDNITTEEGDNLLCQTGQGNVAYNYVEGNKVEGDLVSQTLAQITGEVDVDG